MIVNVGRIPIGDGSPLVLIGDTTLNKCDRHQALPRAHRDNLMQRRRGVDDGIARRTLECNRLIPDLNR